MVVDEYLAHKIPKYEPEDTDDDWSDEEEIQTTTEKQYDHHAQAKDEQISSNGTKPSLISVKRDNPEDLIIRNIEEEMQLKHAPQRINLELLSTNEPRSFGEALNDEHWRNAMREELNQINKSGTWEIVP